MDNSTKRRLLKYSGGFYNLSDEIFGWWLGIVLVAITIILFELQVTNANFVPIFILSTILYTFALIANHFILVHKSKISENEYYDYLISILHSQYSYYVSIVNVEASKLLDKVHDDESLPYEFSLNSDDYLIHFYYYMSTKSGNVDFTSNNIATILSLALLTENKIIIKRTFPYFKNDELDSLELKLNIQLAINCENAILSSQKN